MLVYLFRQRHTDDFALTTDVTACVGRYPFQSVSGRDLLRDSRAFAASIDGKALGEHGLGQLLLVEWRVQTENHYHELRSARLAAR